MKFNEARKIIEFTKKVEKIAGDFYTIAGVEAINHYTRNFRKQGFDDDGNIKMWDKRKRERKKKDSGRAILVGSGGGTLRKSLIRKRAGRFAFYVMSSGTAAKYAGVHNDGLRAGRGKGFMMKKRQFVGESRKLNRIILRKIDNRINKAFEFTR